MPSLRELQLRFVAALFDEREGSLDELVQVDDIAPTHRLDVYRNTLRVAFRRSLALQFPVIEKLVGSDCFTSLALDFQRAHPSRSGDLQHIGSSFAAFLQRQFSGTRFACFEDVAALEWALQVVQVAADAPALDVAALRDIPAADYGALRLQLQPACRVLKSRYPVLAIWIANSDAAAQADLIDLDAGGDWLLVRRTAHGATCERLTQGEHEWLVALTDDATLAQALDAALMVDAAFDLAACLQRCVTREVFAALRAPATQAASDSG